MNNLIFLSKNYVKIDKNWEKIAKNDDFIESGYKSYILNSI